MNPKALGISILCLFLVTAALGQTSQSTTPAEAVGGIVVNCNIGQSLNRTIAGLDKHTRATVLVMGTCTEYVTIQGFDGLTVKGLPGATLVQPSTNPSSGLLIAVMDIEGSRSVTIDGFTVQSPVTGLSGIGIGSGSIDIRLRNLAIQGGPEGIIIFDHSQVSIAYVTGRDPGYAPVGIYDGSDVHLEECLFENTSGAQWHVGIDVGSSHLTIRGTTIRNMQVGINVTFGGIVNVQNFTNYYPASEPSDVLIDNPLGTNFDGVSLTGGSTLAVGATLRITNAGQPWGDTTGGVLVSESSTLTGNNNLVISGSYGQGVTVTNNSHASLDGSHITGSQHGGLVATNLSTISVGSLSPPTVISGNAVDLFCDSRSLITGAAQIANATTVQCTNLVPGDMASQP